MTISNAESRRTTVRLIAERPAEQPAPSAQSEPSSNTLPAQAAAPLTPSKPDYQGQILATMQAVAMVLSARALALLAALGSFILAVMAMSDPNPIRLAVAAFFAVAVFAPTVWLYWKQG